MIQSLLNRLRLWRPLLWCVYRLGLFRLLRLPLRRRAVILCYHKVVPAAVPVCDWIGGPAVDAAVLARQMKFLHRHYNVIEMDALAEAVEHGKPLPPFSAVVTFDDGYMNQSENALPALRANGLPAVFYVCPAFLGTDRLFWWDELTYIFQHTRCERLDMPVGQARFEATLRTEDERRASCRRFSRDHFARLNVDEQGATLDRLRALSGVDPRKDADYVSMCRCMRREMLGDLREAGHTVGLHAEHHAMLPRETPEKRRREIEDSLATFPEGATRHFSYPYGMHDETTVAILREAGFRTAVTTRIGFVRPGDDPYLLNRITASPDFLSFVFEISGLPGYLARLDRWLKCREGTQG
ncbi:MAG: polysaccharide deacetylase family protein [Phycisphaerae bacterium]|nr:polysaccharide deacetylase family protein [Phycisphaerae bacterium]